MTDYRTPQPPPDLAIIPPLLRSDPRSVAIATYLNTIRDIRAERAFLYDLDAVPSGALDALTDQLSAREFLIDGLDEATVRSLLRESFAIHRRKGTPYAVARLLEILGTVVDLREWWQQSPRGTPHTFQAIFWRDENPDLAFNLTADFFETIARLIETAKPVRSSFALYVGARFPLPDDGSGFGGTPGNGDGHNALAIAAICSASPRITATATHHLPIPIATATLAPIAIATPRITISHLPLPLTAIATPTICATFSLNPSISIAAG